MFQIFTLSLLSEAAFYEDDRLSAQSLLSQLGSYRGKMVVFSWGSLLAGSVSYFLGLLSLTKGLRSEAEELFREGMDTEAKFGATALVARTRLALSRALDQRPRGAGKEESELERQRALGTYRNLGLAPPHGLTRGVPRTTDLSPSQVTNALVRPNIPNRIEKSGDYWTISYASKTVRLKPVKGLQYICRLIENQGKEIRALVLAQSGEPPSDTPRPITAGLMGRNAMTCDDLAIDSVAREQYSKRLESLAEQLASAKENCDLGAVRAIESEFGWIEGQMNEALRNRSLGTADCLERARVGVRNNISSALKRVHHYHPDLGRHLDSAIRTGRLCSYRPEQDVFWEIEDLACAFASPRRERTE